MVTATIGAALQRGHLVQGAAQHLKHHSVNQYGLLRCRVTAYGSSQCILGSCYCFSFFGTAIKFLNVYLRECAVCLRVRVAELATSLACFPVGLF